MQWCCFIFPDLSYHGVLMEMFCQKMAYQLFKIKAHLSSRYHQVWSDHWFKFENSKCDVIDIFKGRYTMLPKNASTVLQLTRNKVYAEQIIRWGTNCVNGCLIKLLWNNYESCQSDFDVNTKQKQGKHPFLRFLQSSIFYFRRYLFAHFWCSYSTLKTCDSCCENQQFCLLTWADFIKRAASFDPATRVNKGGRHS